MSRRYLLDTNALGDLCDRRHGVHLRVNEAVLSGAKIGTCPPVLGELFDGLEYSRTQQRNRALMERTLQKVIVWPYHIAEAREFGRIRAELRRNGRAMQTVDMQLAAVAKLLIDCTVVSSDSDLLAIPGLSVENWTTS